MAIKAVISDFGGVLVRTNDHSGRLKWDHYLHHSDGFVNNLVFESETARLATIGEVGEDQVWKYVKQELGLSSLQLDDFRKDFWSGDILDLELVHYINSLRPALHTVVLSNAWSEARKMFLETYHLDQYFDEFFISSEEGFAKPQKEIYVKALQQLGVNPEEAIFIDDVNENILAAAKIGIHALHFKTTKQVINQIKSLIL